MNPAADSSTAATVCMCVIAGVPGAGKSTLTELMASRAPPGVQIVSVQYDEFIADPSWAAPAGPALEANGERSWKEQRGEILRRVRETLDGLTGGRSANTRIQPGTSAPPERSNPAAPCTAAGPPGAKQLVILDDNMYYARYAYPAAIPMETVNIERKCQTLPAKFCGA